MRIQYFLAKILFFVCIWFFHAHDTKVLPKIKFFSTYQNKNTVGLKADETRM
jgi:hypothetical protein